MVEEDVSVGVNVEEEEDSSLVLGPEVGEVVSSDVAADDDESLD